MSESYLIPQQSVRVSQEISRSRFIASLAHAADEMAAQEFIRRKRAEFADASHNCYAFVAGPPGSSARVGCSDDGEPHGTAGRPMLHCLMHSDLGEAAVVVTRYFGGIKLGRGGLVRAYAGSVKQALAQTPTTPKRGWAHLQLRIGYPLLARLEYGLADFEAEVTSKEFSQDVLLAITLPIELRQSFEAFAVNLTAGNVEIEEAGT